MNTSNEISELSAALAKAQGQFVPAKRSRKNEFLKYQYATLADIIEAIRKPMADNGLCFIQTPEDGAEGAVTVQTTLYHSSGQWIAGRVSLSVSRAAAGNVKVVDAQAFMSAFTSAKRIGLTALLGVAIDEDEDDDGNAASHGTSRQAQSGNGNSSAPKPDLQKITADQIVTIRKLCGEEYGAEETAQAWFDLSLENLTFHQGIDYVKRIREIREKLTAEANAQKTEVAAHEKL